MFLIIRVRVCDDDESNRYIERECMCDGGGGGVRLGKEVGREKK